MSLIIDISKYQSRINWPALKANKQGVTGVYIKATEGHNYTDEEFCNHVNGAIVAGVAFGFYHFATLNSADVVADSTQEANDFANRVAGVKAGLPYVLDIERNDAKLTKEQVLKWVQTFISTLNGRGITNVAIYSYAPFLNSNLPNGHNLGHLPLWVAAYAPAYQLPNGWGKAYLWQYSQKGMVDGVTGNVDVSKYVD